MDLYLAKFIEVDFASSTCKTKSDMFHFKCVVCLNDHNGTPADRVSELEEVLVEDQSKAKVLLLLFTHEDVVYDPIAGHKYEVYVENEQC